MEVPPQGPSAGSTLLDTRRGERALVQNDNDTGILFRGRRESCCSPQRTEPGQTQTAAWLCRCQVRNFKLVLSKTKGKERRRKKRPLSTRRSFAFSLSKLSASLAPLSGSPDLLAQDWHAAQMSIAHIVAQWQRRQAVFQTGTDGKKEKEKHQIDQGPHSKVK